MNPKETPKRPIQCYNSTECKLTFDVRHKLNKHTGEQYEGKFQKSLEKKSPRTKPKTNIKICNSNKKEFKEQVTAEREEINVKIVTKDVKKRKIFRIFSPKQERKTSR